MLLQKLYWMRVIDLIIQNYLAGTTICMLWHPEIDFALEKDGNVSSLAYSSFIIIERHRLENTSTNDVVDYNPKQKLLADNGIEYDDLIMRLTIAIEKSHCTVFWAFDDDIKVFVESFKKASRYSVWRSIKNKFLFGFRNEQTERTVFEHDFFDEQSSILVIEHQSPESALFKLKTNLFTGPKRSERRSLYLLDVFNAEQETLLYGAKLFPNKHVNLEGRELVVAALHYRPTVTLEYGPQYHVQDLAIKDLEQQRVKVDGTEMRTIITFCEVYNCTLQINTEEADDWGFAYLNQTGDGTLGMVVKGTADVGMGAMYTWIAIYRVLDMSVYISRHGITCVVPAPNRLTSWLLPLQPFQGQLWATVVLFLVIESFALFLVHKTEARLGAEREYWVSSLIFAFVITLRIFLSQNTNEYIFSMSMRLMLFSCLLNDIIVTSIYGGGLASILTVPSLEEAADSVARLRSHNLKWVADSEAWITSLRDTKDPNLSVIVKNYKSYTEEELRVKAMTEKIGFALERLPFGHYALEDYLTEEVLQHMKIMIDDIYFQYTVLFTARQWPLLEAYNDLLYMWHSSGFDKYWEWRVVNENMNSQLQKMLEASIRAGNEDLGPVSLDMSNFAGMIIIWVLGISLAILTFFAEFIHKRRKSKQRTSTGVLTSALNGFIVSQNSQLNCQKSDNLTANAQC